MTKTIVIREDIMERIVTLQKVVDRQITQRDAADELHLTDRHVRRLIKCFKTKGWEGLIPQAKGGNRRFEGDFKEKVLRAVRQDYSDFGPTFAAEKLEEMNGLSVSRETLRQWMIDDGLWRSKRQKAARIHQTRQRRSRFGELVQIDGSPHDWFEGRAPKCCLIVMVDDATSRIIQAHFEPTETTFAYMKCMKKHLKKYGKPLAYYSDKHSIFKTTKEKCVDCLLEDTQLHRALKELKIELICANSPQAKGRVERANGVLQDRLVKEMRLHRISNIADGNAYLDIFINNYNAKFGVTPADLQDTHRPLTQTDQALEMILSIHTTRRISKNLEIHFNKKIYQIQGVGNGYRLRHAHVTVHETPYGIIKIRHDGKELSYQIFEDKTGLQEVDTKDLNAVMDDLVKKGDFHLCYPQTPQPLNPLAL